MKYRIFPERKIFIYFLASVVTTYVLASISQSIFVLIALESTGVNIPITAWLGACVHDLYGLTFSGVLPYGLMVFVGFLIAFLVTFIMRKVLPWPTMILYPLAGATAMATMLYVVDVNFFDGTMHAGTRGWLAFIGQLLAGGIGGAVFAIGLSTNLLPFKTPDKGSVI